LGGRGASVARRRAARAWGDHNWAGIRRRAADDAACDAADRCANRAAYDCARYRAASRACHGAIAVGKRERGQSGNRQCRKSNNHAAHDVLLVSLKRPEETRDRKNGSKK
jgi:hypothetical protein